MNSRCWYTPPANWLGCAILMVLMLLSGSGLAAANGEVSGYLWAVRYENCCGSTEAFVICGTDPEACLPETWPSSSMPLVGFYAYRGGSTYLIIDGQSKVLLTPDGSFKVDSLGEGVHRLQVVDEANGGELTRPLEFRVTPGETVLDIRAFIEMPWKKRFGIQNY